MLKAQMDSVLVALMFNITPLIHSAPPTARSPTETGSFTGCCHKPVTLNHMEVFPREDNVSL